MSPRPGVLALVEILKSMDLRWLLDCCSTVDGQNPAPPRMIINPLFIGLENHPRSLLGGGGGFKYFLFSSLLGEGFQFDEHIFQMG